MCVCAGADVPGEFPSVSGEAAGSLRSAEEGSDPRFGETLAPQGGGEDAAHLRPGHAGRDRYVFTEARLHFIGSVLVLCQMTMNLNLNLTSQHALVSC